MIIVKTRRPSLIRGATSPANYRSQALWEYQQRGTQKDLTSKGMIRFMIRFIPGTLSLCLLMRLNFHESFAQGAIKPPSERSTGLTLVAVTLLIAYLWRDNPAVLVSAVCAGGVLALLSAFAPTALRLPNLLWFRFSMLLHKVVNPIVMLSLFAVVVVPGGLLMRIFRDPLRARRDSKLTTYWVERTGDDEGACSMQHQF